MKRPVTKRSLQAQQTRDLIISKGKSLFRQNGFENTTVDDICNACGIAKGTFYHYFSSKLQFVAEDTADALTELEDILSRSYTKDVVKDVTMIISSYYRYLESRGVSYMRQIRRYLLECAEKGDSVTSASSRLSEFIDERIGMAMEDGYLSEELPRDKLKDSFRLFIMGSLSLWEINPEVYPLKVLEEGSVSFFVNSVLSPFLSGKE